MSFHGVKDLASYISSSYCEHYIPLPEKDPREKGKSVHDTILNVVKKYFEKQNYVCEEEKGIHYSGSVQQLPGKIDLYCENRDGTEIIIVEVKSYNIGKIHQSDIAQASIYARSINRTSGIRSIKCYLIMGKNPIRLVRVVPMKHLDALIKMEGEYRPGFWCGSCTNKDCMFSGV